MINHSASVRLVAAPVVAPEAGAGDVQSAGGASHPDEGVPPVLHAQALPFSVKALGVPPALNTQALPFAARGLGVMLGLSALSVTLPANGLGAQQIDAGELATSIRENALSAARQGIEGALAAQQAELDAAIARGDEAAVAEHQEAVEGLERGLEQLAARTGVSVQQTGTLEPPPLPGDEIPDVPDGVLIITLAFFAMIVLLALGIPIVRAYTRRTSRPLPAALPDAETQAQLHDIGLAVDAIAIEVERLRIGRG